MPASVFYSYRTTPNVWSPYITVSGNISGVNPKLTAETDGTCHVVFEKRSGNILTGDIYYTGNASGNWQVQFLQSGEKYQPSIVVDQYGNCSTVYYQYNAAANDADVYYYGYVGEIVPPQMTVLLDPVGGPIQIPAGGGPFTFNLSIHNDENAAVNFDFWLEAQLPTGAIYSPIALRTNLSIAGGGTIIRNGLTQNVPGSAPAGEYIYIAKTGDFPSVVYAQDSFPFVKLGMDAAAGGNWELYGIDNEPANIATPGDYVLLIAYPNPFNAETTISVTLPASGEISMKVYDIAGREIQDLGFGIWDLGTHSVVWEAEGCGSGVYFIRLTMEGGQSSVRKVVFMK